jgi:EAL domain-containing protein (putative c-di-GMP-specific phosphodiesterase class I)
LREFDFDTLKIDRSFIREMLTKPEEARIVTVAGAAKMIAEHVHRTAKLRKEGRRPLRIA